MAVNAVNQWKGGEEELRSPEAAASGIEAVTPSDTAELSTVSRALWVGTGGNVVVVMFDRTTATIANVPDSTLLPIRVRQVKSTGTTASGITSWY